MQPDLEQIKNYLKSFMEELEKDEGVDFVILPTENEEHGFWGELKEVDIPEELLQTYWNIISEHLQSECDMSPELTRDFLDSKAGRYLVDDLERNDLVDNDDFSRVIKRFLTKAEVKKRLDMVDDG